MKLALYFQEIVRSRMAMCFSNKLINKYIFICVLCLNCSLYYRINSITNNSELFWKYQTIEESIRCKGKVFEMNVNEMLVNTNWLTLWMLTKTGIGKKSDAHDSKESYRFASQLKKKQYLLYENLYLNKLESLFTKECICGKFGWNWPSDSREKDF